MSAKEKQFRKRGGGVSQCRAILERLQLTPGVDVPLLELERATKVSCLSRSMAIHSRIADLRADGHRIIQKNQYERGVCKSFYRLELSPRSNR